MTTFADCERELIRHGGQPLLDGWTSSDEVQAFVLGFEHRVIDRVTLAELDEVRVRNEARVEPLGQLRSSEAVNEIDDFYSEYPLAALFHLCVESMGRVPDWQEYWTFVTSAEHRAKAYDGFRSVGRGVEPVFGAERIAHAIQWRFGNAYNSSFREVWTQAWLRERAGISACYHLFADTQLQTDLWYGRVLICLRVPSRKLERKLSPVAWAQVFQVVNVDIGHGGSGKMWLPSEQQLAILASLQPVPGGVTTIRADGTVIVDRPLPGVGLLPAPNGAGLASVAGVCQALGLASVPRYSLTLVGSTLTEGQAHGLLRAGIKVIWFAPQAAAWPELEPYRQGKLLHVHALPVGVAHGQKLPVAVVDGAATPADLRLLDGLGQAVVPFNYEQWQVEHAPAAEHLQVSAGAGTGKTAVMVDRVMYLIHMVQDLSLADIVMITFTREATRVMRERLRRALEIRYRLTGRLDYLRRLEELASMQVSTIPSFARRLLQAAGSTLGYGQNFRIREFGRDRKAILTKILDRKLEHARQGHRLQELLHVPLYRFVEVADAYWREMENKGLGPDDIANLDWGTAVDPESRFLQSVWPDLFTEAEQELQALKERTNSISLADLTRQIQLVGGQLRSLAQSGLTMRYLFVDEFQDSDDTQIQLVVALQQHLHANVFVVGDIKQSIYRFRGATYTAFEELSQRLAAAGVQMAVFPLRKNYRTSANVLAAMEPFFARWGAEQALPYDAGSGLVGVVDAQGEFRVVTYDEDGPLLKDRVMAWIREARNSVSTDPVTGREERVAVLVRTNKQAALIKRWCDEDPSGIFCEIDRGGTLFASVAAHHFHALVEALLYPEEPLAMLNLLATPFSQVALPWPALLASKGDRAALQALIRQNPPSIGWYPQQGAGAASLVERVRTEPVLALLRQALEELQPVQRYFDTELTNLKAEFPQQDEAELRQEASNRATQYELNLDRIMELIHATFSEEFATLYSVHTWLDIQQATNRNENEPPLPDEAQKGRIHCMSVHKAKGDEFHTVILPFTHRRFRTPGNELLLEFDPACGVWQAGWLLQHKREGEWERFHNKHHFRLARVEQDQVFREETRLLYVALTRCQRRLWAMQYTKGEQNWGRLLRPADKGGRP